MCERKPRYRHARLEAGRDKTVLRCGVVSASPVPTDKPHPQFLLIFFHNLVSTYFGGHLMPQRIQWQKVRGNSRLPSAEWLGSRPGRDASGAQILNAIWNYAVAPAVGLKSSPVLSIVCMITANLRAAAMAAHLKPILSRSPIEKL